MRLLGSCWATRSLTPPLCAFEVLDSPSPCVSSSSGGFSGKSLSEPCTRARSGWYDDWLMPHFVKSDFSTIWSKFLMSPTVLRLASKLSWRKLKAGSTSTPWGSPAHAAQRSPSRTSSGSCAMSDMRRRAAAGSRTMKFGERRRQY